MRYLMVSLSLNFMTGSFSREYLSNSGRRELFDLMRFSEYRAEYRAVEKVFGGKFPALTTNKWKIGHTFGASGMLSLEMAVQMLQNQAFVKVPYLPANPIPDRFRYAMVNAVGFGGNAVSIVIQNPSVK